MTSEQFCYWLQGQFELKGGDTKLSQDQIEMIAKHLQSVFDPILREPYKHEFDITKFNPDWAKPMC